MDPERRHTLATWNYREWGAIIGVALVIISALLGVGIAALAVIGGLVGYLIGRFMEGELDLSSVQERARQRNRGVR